MEMLFMSASVVVAIVLSVVGIFKLPFGNLKEKHPQLYKSIFTLISIVLSVGLCVVDEIYIIHGAIFSFDFGLLVCVVIAGVFGGYSGIYEGLGLKELMKKLKDSLKKASELSKDKKIKKLLDSKVTDIDQAIAFLEEKKRKNSEV